MVEVRRTPEEVIRDATARQRAVTDAMRAEGERIRAERDTGQPPPPTAPAETEVAP